MLLADRGSDANRVPSSVLMAVLQADSDLQVKKLPNFLE